MKIKECLESLFKAVEIDVPDSVDILEANELQSKNPLDPFDSIGLSIIRVSSAVLISRDNDFIELVRGLNVEACTPEEFLEKKFSNVFEKVKNELGETGNGLCVKGNG